MNLLKKQLVKRNYHKETLKITIDMAWPAIVESFFVAFAGLKKEGEVDQNVFAEYKAKFVDAISNDLNTSMAITVLYDLLKADTNDITKYELIKDFDKVLSLNLENAKSTETTEGVDAELESFVLAKIEERKEAKKAKDFAKADAIRDELLAKGIVIKDTREGVVWHKAE